MTEEDDKDRQSGEGRGGQWKVKTKLVFRDGRAQEVEAEDDEVFEAAEDEAVAADDAIIDTTVLETRDPSLRFAKEYQSEDGRDAVQTHVIDDPAFEDDFMLRGEDIEPTPAPVFEHASYDVEGADPVKLAIVGVGAILLIGAFFMFAIPSFDDEGEVAVLPPETYPNVEIKRTQPMNRRSAQDWLTKAMEKSRSVLRPDIPPPVATSSETRELVATAPPKGHLFIPDRKRAIELDASRTPSRPGIKLVDYKASKSPDSRRPAAIPYFQKRGEIKNSEEIFGEENNDDGEELRIPLAVGDSFAVKLHSGVSSISGTRIVLAKVSKNVAERGQVLIPKDTIIRGLVRRHGENRFFFDFGEFTLNGRKYVLTGRAEERDFAGVVGIRREATFKERQKFTIVDGVLSGLAGASYGLSTRLPLGAREASQTLAQGTRNNARLEYLPDQGFVLEVARGKRFRILVTE